MSMLEEKAYHEHSSLGTKFLGLPLTSLLLKMFYEPLPLIYHTCNKLKNFSFTYANKINVSLKNYFQTLISELYGSPT